MNNILLFFALPVATIILAVVLQKVLKCPMLVAATFFAIYLILTYTAFNTEFLIFTIAYTIIAYITATLTKCISKLIKQINRCNNNNECEEIILTNRCGNNAGRNCFCRRR